MSGSKGPNKPVRAIGLGVAVGIGVGGFTWALGFFPVVSVALGLVMGIGAALVLAPLAPKLLKVTAGSPPPPTVQGSLDRVIDSVKAMEGAMGRLESSRLWDNTDLDERIGLLLGSLRNLAEAPSLRKRETLDGDVNMLYTLGTDYLPTIVNLVIENDRMHASFTGSGSRAEVQQNVQSLRDQVVILAEVADHIETNIVRGTSQSVEEHAAFLQMRFAQAGTNSVLDLSTPMQPQPLPGAAGGAGGAS